MDTVITALWAAAVARVEVAVAGQAAAMVHATLMVLATANLERPAAVVRVPTVDAACSGQLPGQDHGYLWARLPKQGSRCRPLLGCGWYQPVPHP